MVGELERIHERLKALRNERAMLIRELLKYANEKRDARLLEWLGIEHRRFLVSLSTMNRTHKEAEDARARELNDFDELRDYLVHALELEQLAIQEASLHEAYLRNTIAKLKAKKTDLGLT